MDKKYLEKSQRFLHELRPSFDSMLVWAPACSRWFFQTSAAAGGLLILLAGFLADLAVCVCRLLKLFFLALFVLGIFLLRVLLMFLFVGVFMTASFILRLADTGYSRLYVFGSRRCTGKHVYLPVPASSCSVCAFRPSVNHMLIGWSCRRRARHPYRPLCIAHFTYPVVLRGQRLPGPYLRRPDFILVCTASSMAEVRPDKSAGYVRQVPGRCLPRCSFILCGCAFSTGFVLISAKTRRRGTLHLGYSRPLLLGYTCRALMPCYAPLEASLKKPVLARLAAACEALGAEKALEYAGLHSRPEQPARARSENYHSEIMKLIRAETKGFRCLSAGLLAVLLAVTFPASSAPGSASAEPSGTIHLYEQTVYLEYGTNPSLLADVYGRTDGEGTLELHSADIRSLFGMDYDSDGNLIVHTADGLLPVGSYSMSLSSDTSEEMFELVVQDTTPPLFIRQTPEIRISASQPLPDVHTLFEASDLSEYELCWEDLPSGELNPGPYQIRVTARDVHGNESSVSCTLIITPDAD